MSVHSLLAALLACASIVTGAATGLERRHGADCLKSSVIQSASSKTGQEEGTPGIKAGQSPSEVNDFNFINFCAGERLTNGQQFTTGTSCNGIPQGHIPAKSNMISSIILYPQPGDRIAANTAFNVTVQTVALSAGYLVNPTTNYYTAPQRLDAATGFVIGHCHVTVQSIGSLRTTTVPDPATFVHFKGIDDAGDGKGKLQTTITDGLPVGAYRICTMISSRNHAPVVMPVAQRGAQDDCTKFEVV